MSAPRIQYAANGDVHIAYQVLGDGPLDLVFVAGAITNLEVLWEMSDYRRACERLASFARLILFDKRGMGLSDRVRVGTLEERMDDVRAILDAVGSETAVLMGVSEGGPMSILFAASYPERTRSLVLCGAEVKEETTDDWNALGSQEPSSSLPVLAKDPPKIFLEDTRYCREQNPAHVCF